MFDFCGKEKNPFRLNSGYMKRQLVVCLLGLYSLVVPAWGQVTDPLPVNDPAPGVPAAPTDPIPQNDPVAPADPLPVVVNAAPELLDVDDTASGTYLLLRNRRQWHILSVRSRLLRAPRDRRVDDAAVEQVEAAGDMERPLLALLPAERLQIMPTAAVPVGGWTLWSALDASRVKDVRTAFRKRGHVAGVTLGLERSLGTAITLGTSVSYAYTRQTTYFNGGRSRIHGLTVTPYVSLMPAAWLNLTITGGYVYNRERLSWLSAGALASGRRHSNGYTLGAVAEASRWFDSVLLTARTGFVMSRDSWKPFVDSLGVVQPAMKDRVVQWTVEAGGAMWLDPVMPYFNVAYTRDLKRPAQETDRDDFTLNGGLSWYGSGTYQNVSADLSGSVVLGRKSQRNYTFSLGLRISF